MRILLQNLLHDLQFAIRQLRKSPGFTITAVLTLAVGIGANTASFSIMDAVVLRPLAVPDLNRVVTVYEQQNSIDGRQVALANFEDWQRQSHSFESIAVRGFADMSLTGAGDAAHVQASLTTPAFFKVMRTSPFAGRVFNESETQPGRGSVAVLSYYFWKTHFAADPAILGRTIELDQHAYNVDLPAAHYDTPQKTTTWYKQSLERLQALPGVQHAEATSALPYSDQAWIDDFQIENRPLAPGQSQPAMRLTVSAGYFNQFHIGLVSGRLFSASDDLRSQPVAVVSKSLADRYFPGENVLGKRIRMKTGSAEQTPWLTIVGVVEETTYSLWQRSRPAAVYADALQLPQSGLTYAITTSGDPEAIAPEVHKALAAVDPGLPLDELDSYEKFMHVQLTGMFYVAAMLGFDALVALVLAAIGIFGVMANLVGERTREIGVRLAMGARREDVLRMILRRAGWMTGAGVSVGLVLAFALAHGVANLLYEVRPDDPLVFGAITASIIAVALLASWFPARRAAHIDPMVALRDE